MKKRHIQKFVVLGIGLWLLFNVPFILLNNEATSFLGIPIFYVYLFSVWILGILISYFIITKYNE
ncbi:hypothetical protein [Flavobacterium sp.]|uniref:hypothetical protein n=1 Tax=Flavobacterium sp. TaxID=239 RepID=UPI002FD90A1F